MADIDIDFQTLFKPQQLFVEAVQASMIEKNKLVKHPCGYYFQNIAADNVTGFSAVPYKIAETLGYFKIDFLHLSLLDAFSSKEEIRVLIKKEPNWALLLDKHNVEKLFQLNKNFHLVNMVQPKSVEELADCVALIRPGKRQLLPQYIKDKENIRPLLYRQIGDAKSAFKKCHAIAYSLTIVLQLHLIEAGVL